MKIELTEMFSFT